MKSAYVSDEDVVIYHFFMTKHERVNYTSLFF